MNDLFGSQILILKGIRKLSAIDIIITKGENDW